MASLNSCTGCTLTENLQNSWETAKPAHRQAKRAKSFWYFGTWNIRSLLDNERPIEVARLGPAHHQFSEDQRIDLSFENYSATTSLLLGYRKLSGLALQFTQWARVSCCQLGNLCPSQERTCREGSVWHLFSVDLP